MIKFVQEHNDGLHYYCESCGISELLGGSKERLESIKDGTDQDLLDEDEVPFYIVDQRHKDVSTIFLCFHLAEEGF